MAVWTLDTPVDIMRDNIVPFPDTVDEIRIARVNIIFEKIDRQTTAFTLNVLIQYGLRDAGFVTIWEEAFVLEDESFANVMQTTTSAGKIRPRLETLIWAELLRLGLIPAGS